MMTNIYRLLCYFHLCTAIRMELFSRSCELAEMVPNSNCCAVKQLYRNRHVKLSFQLMMLCISEPLPKDLKIDDSEDTRRLILKFILNFLRRETLKSNNKLVLIVWFSFFTILLDFNDHFLQSTTLLFSSRYCAI